MLRNAHRVFALTVLLAVASCGAALAAEKRRCETFLAIFPDANHEEAVFRLTITVSDKAATVKVHRSAEWTGSHIRNAIGADTIVFDTGHAIETLTISTRGELLWEIAYKDVTYAGKRVIAFAGMCRPWKAQ